MSTVLDHYDEDDFESLLLDAESNAATDWEEQFVADLKRRYEQFHAGMFISTAQREQLERIADDES